MDSLEDRLWVILKIVNYLKWSLESIMNFNDIKGSEPNAAALKNKLLKTIVMAKQHGINQMVGLIKDVIGKKKDMVLKYFKLKISETQKKKLKESK